jgi:hypothetical protein
VGELGRGEGKVEGQVRERAHEFRWRQKGQIQSLARMSS